MPLRESPPAGSGRLAAGHAFGDGSDTPRAMLERCLARIAETDPDIHAFVALAPDTAHTAADAATARWRDARPLSPIDGVPIAVKDVIETAEMPTACNSPILAGWSGRRDAAIVATLRRAGAVIVGKTVTTEFAVGAAGPTRNPRDPARSPGGSSSGSAAAVAAGMLPLAIGTQTQSSTLRPASYCGVFGFKPTHGLLPLGGVHPLAPTMDHPGLLAGTLADLCALTQVLTGCDASDTTPPRRLGLLTTSGAANPEPAALAALHRYARHVADRGVAIVTPADSPALAAFADRLHAADAISDDILAYEMRWPFGAYRDAHGNQLGRRVAGLVQRGEAITAEAYAQRLQQRAGLRDALIRLGAELDGLLTLAAGGPAPLGLEIEGPPPGARSFAIPASLLGAPAFSLPVLSVEGLPLGLQIIAPPGQDTRLAGLAQWLIDQEPWRP